jgi:hypothetical protein
MSASAGVERTADSNGSKASNARVNVTGKCMKCYVNGYPEGGNPTPHFDRTPRRRPVFAIIAAILFGLALLLELAKADLGSVLTAGTLTTAGLLFFALHFCGTGAWRSLRRR